MQTYSLRRKKHAGDMGSKKDNLTNNVITQASKYANCVAKKSRFLKQKLKKSGWDKISPKFVV